eukprot:scaffold754_cov248-Pinguiococcus_pyrenoidosus.AAC.35
MLAAVELPVQPPGVWLRQLLQGRLHHPGPHAVHPESKHVPRQHLDHPAPRVAAAGLGDALQQLDHQEVSIGTHAEVEDPGLHFHQNLVHLLRRAEADHGLHHSGHVVLQTHRGVLPPHQRRHLVHQLPSVLGGNLPIPQLVPQAQQATHFLALPRSRSIRSGLLCALLPRRPAVLRPLPRACGLFIGLCGAGLGLLAHRLGRAFLALVRLCLPLPGLARHAR